MLAFGRDLTLYLVLVGLTRQLKALVMTSVADIFMLVDVLCQPSNSVDVSYLWYLECCDVMG